MIFCRGQAKPESNKNNRSATTVRSWISTDSKPTRAPLVQARAAGFGGGVTNVTPGEKESLPLRFLSLSATQYLPISYILLEFFN